MVTKTVTFVETSPLPKAYMKEKIINSDDVDLTKEDVIRLLETNCKDFVQAKGNSEILNVSFSIVVFNIGFLDKNRRLR